MMSKAKEALVQTFLGALREDQIPWHRCWSTTRPSNIQTGIAYRGTNNLTLSYIAAERGYSDPRWMSFKQAEDYGWHVRKCETATRVEFWHYYDKDTEKALDSAEVRRIEIEEPDRKKNIRLSAYTYCVFNAEQVDGVPQLAHPTTTANVGWLRESRDIFLGNLDVRFYEGGDRACYMPGADCIHMPPIKHFTGDYDYVCALLHEAGHATGHCIRLNRHVEDWFGSSDYAREELRAELASAFTAQRLGLPMNESERQENVEQHKAYIQSWIGILEKNPEELFAAIKAADQITDYLMEHGKVMELGMPPAMEAEAESSLAVQGEDWEP